MKISDLCEADRPREKLLAKGAQALGNSELLAILLRNGTKEESVIELAHRLLSAADGRLSALSSMSAEAMGRIKGIGQCKAAQLSAAFELGRRFMREGTSAKRKSITCARMVYDLMIPELKGLDHEETWMLAVNSQNYVIKKLRVCVGAQDETLMDVRQILRHALELGASGIFLVHNHPSGEPSPSVADCQQTEKLHKALKSVNIRLIDHIVIANSSFFSFSEECIMLA